MLNLEGFPYWHSHVLCLLPKIVFFSLFVTTQLKGITPPQLLIQNQKFIWVKVLYLSWHNVRCLTFVTRINYNSILGWSYLWLCYKIICMTMIITYYKYPVLITNVIYYRNSCLKGFGLVNIDQVNYFIRVFQHSCLIRNPLVTLWPVHSFDSVVVS